MTDAERFAADVESVVVFAADNGCEGVFRGDMPREEALPLMRTYMEERHGAGRRQSMNLFTICNWMLLDQATGVQLDPVYIWYRHRYHEDLSIEEILGRNTWKQKDLES